MVPLRYDLARIILAVLFITALIGMSLWIMRPFLPAVIWAATLVIATWPIMRRLQTGLWNSRALATIVMTIALLLVFVVPLWLAIATIVDNADQIIFWAQAVGSMDLPPPPSWVAGLPVLGPKAAHFWQARVDTGLHELLQKAWPYAGSITQWFIAVIGSFGLVLVQFLLTVVISTIMYAKGEIAAAAVVRFAIRLGGVRGEQSVALAAQAIRGVALGVVVTAFFQSTVGGIGLMVAGVPFASVLWALMFMLCIAQIGPAPVLVPAVIWMFVRHDPGWATVLLVFSLFAVIMDNFLRPILIRKGAHLPLLLILSGVIGGLMAFGLIGIFLGPTVLAVGYTLLAAWIVEGDQVSRGAQTLR